MRRRVRPVRAAAGVWIALAVGCSDPGPTGLHVTVIALRLEAVLEQIDQVVVTTQVDADEPRTSTLDLESSGLDTSESLNVVMRGADAGLPVRVTVEARAAGVRQGSGFAEVDLVLGELLDVDVTLSICEAASGAFCEGSELVTCDLAADATVRTTCVFGCEPTTARCLDCQAGTTECQGRVLVQCDAAGNILEGRDCGIGDTACSVGACTTGGCVRSVVPDDTDCDDGLFCTEGTTCQAGSCTAGAPKRCDDGNGCTFDLCDEASGACTAASGPFDGLPCDDGNFCILGEVCSGGSCGGGRANVCDDGNGCTGDSCDESADACVNDAAGRDGLPCVGSDFCRVGQICTAGACGGGTARSCDDANVCTADSCDPASAVCRNASLPDTTPCDDGLFCSLGTTCTSGACGGGAVRDCSDGQQCTFDRCDETDDQCVSDAVPFEGAACDDGNFCVIGERCAAGACAGGAARDCDDANPCSADSCNELGDACNHVTAAFEGASCSSGDFCTVGERCTAGLCGGGTPRSCDDGNACTTDVCDALGGGCLSTTVPDGTACDLGFYCNLGTQCTAGACGGGAPRNCADANPCSFDTCNEAQDRCDHDPAPFDGDPCVGTDFCVLDQSCAGGACGGGAPRDCDDGNPCTADTCSEPGDVCFNAPRPDGSNCDDGLFCTLGDVCGAGLCQPGAQDPCRDSNPCTSESCDEAGDGCAVTCAPAGSQCVDAFLQATCDGTCDPPATVLPCSFGCNAARQACNECAPGSTECRADVSLLCNAEVTCNAVGLVSGTRCCTSNRCTCDGSICLEDICAAAPDVSAGGTLSGNTCDAQDNVPGDCNPAGAACLSPAQGGSPEEMFRFVLNNGTPTSGFYNVVLDPSASAMDTDLRVATGCGNETLHMPTADVCALPAGVGSHKACDTSAGRDVMVLCGLPEGTYFGAVDSAAGTCGGYAVNVAINPVNVDTATKAGNVSRGGVFTGNTCGLAGDYSFPTTKSVTGCTGEGNCTSSLCPACDSGAAADCTLSISSSLCSFSGTGSPDAVFYLALPVDSGVDLSTAGSSFNTVLYLMETGPTGASPPGAVQKCNDDCWAPLGASHIQTSLAAGLYYVYLDGAGGACGDYRLSVTVAPAAVCPNLACDLGFESCESCPLDCPCPSCGDGVLDSADAEECDDGDNAGGDCCSARCAVEPGCACFGSPSVCGVVTPRNASVSCACAVPDCTAGGSCSACTSSNAGTRTSVANIAGACTVAGVTLDLDVTHPWRGDLTVELASPGGTVVRLHNRSGGGADNLLGTYPQSLVVDGPGTLGDFVGQNGTGAWTLTVRDWQKCDTGTLNSWALHLSCL